MASSAGSRRFLTGGWIIALVLASHAGPPFLIPAQDAAATRPGASAPEDEARGAESRFAAHLAAGEFGPAIELARNTHAASRRDTMWAEIANAQRNAGARYAATHAASSIQDRQLRNAAFGGFGRESGSLRSGSRGGAALADFDTLIELIKTTVAPDSWDDAGGVGAAEAFPTGVLVDTAGTLRRGALTSPVTDESLLRVRRSALSSSGNRDVRQSSHLRKVSLPRLEREVQRQWALGRRPDEAMRALAGLTRIQYVMVFPESGDLVLAGPAGDWTRDLEGRLVGQETGQPVVQLDDLVVLLRRELQGSPPFGCAITPRQENLAALQQFVAESAVRSLRPGERAGWLAELRRKLGLQDIEVFGINAQTRLARVLVEADYRMKLVGMGLEPGTLGVPSYLAGLDASADSPSGLDVLRWWFTLKYDAPRSTPARDVFQLMGPGVQVLSENELLAERGERVHTGESSHLNRQFASSFTRHFDDLAIKYPVYADLRNIFDLAFAVALMRVEDLPGRCAWQPGFFAPQGGYAVERGIAPRQVESVINHRTVNRRQLVVGVSGGVRADPAALVRQVGVRTDNYGALRAELQGAQPPSLHREAWWWD